MESRIFLHSFLSHIKLDCIACQGQPHPTFQSFVGTSNKKVLQITFINKLHGEAFSKALFDTYKISKKNNASLQKSVQKNRETFCLYLEEDEVLKYCAHHKLDVPANFSLDVFNAPFDNFVNLTKPEKEALEIITSGNALIKIIGTSISNDRHLNNVDYYLKQLTDSSYRPSRAQRLKGFHKGQLVNKYDLLNDCLIYSYKVGSGRQQKYKNNPNHVYTHTAKTATSLIPRIPKHMKLYDNEFTQDVIFIWDIRTADLKGGKYVFLKNAYSWKGFWLHGKKKKISAIAELRAENENAIAQNRIIDWNEILACLPLGTLPAIALRQNTPYARLHKLRVMYHAKEELEFEEDIPIFKLLPGEELQNYSYEERILDVIYAIQNKDDLVNLLQEGELFNLLQENNFELLKQILQSALEQNREIIGLDTCLVMAWKLGVMCDDRDAKEYVFESMYERQALPELLSLLDYLSFNKVLEECVTQKILQPIFTNKGSNTYIVKHFITTGQYESALTFINKGSCEFAALDSDTKEELIKNILRFDENLQNEKSYQVIFSLINDFKRGDVESALINTKLELTLKNKLSLLYFKRNYTNPLHRAVRRGNKRLIKLFLEQPDITVNDVNIENETPIEIALRDNYPALENLLIFAKHPVTYKIQKPEDFEKVLNSAILNSRPSTVDWLLSQNVKLNTEKMQALVVSNNTNVLQIVCEKLLLEISEQDKHLLIASLIKNNQHQLISKVVAKISSFENCPYSVEAHPLLDAIKNSDDSLLKELIDKKLFDNLDLAFINAWESGNIKLIAILMQPQVLRNILGASFHAVIPHALKLKDKLAVGFLELILTSPYFFYNPDLFSMGTIVSLKPKFIDVIFKNKDMLQHLSHYPEIYKLAVENENLYLVEKLKRHVVAANYYRGALDLNDPNNTILHFAVADEDTFLIENLIGRFDITKPNSKGLTPFDLALYHKNFNIVLCMLSHGRDADKIGVSEYAKDFISYYQDTQEFNLLYALEKKDLNLFRWLCLNGASLTGQNVDILELALQQKMYLFVEVILNSDSKLSSAQISETFVDLLANKEFKLAKKLLPAINDTIAVTTFPEKVKQAIFNLIQPVKDTEMVKTCLLKFSHYLDDATRIQIFTILLDKNRKSLINFYVSFNYVPLEWMPYAANFIQNFGIQEFLDAVKNSNDNYVSWLCLNGVNASTCVRSDTDIKPTTIIAILKYSPVSHLNSNYVSRLGKILGSDPNTTLNTLAQIDLPDKYMKMLLLRFAYHKLKTFTSPNDALDFVEAVQNDAKFSVLFKVVHKHNFLQRYYWDHKAISKEGMYFYTFAKNQILKLLTPHHSALSSSRVSEFLGKSTSRFSKHGAAIKLFNLFRSKPEATTAKIMLRIKDAESSIKQIAPLVK